jgi:hypothetical protein
MSLATSHLFDTLLISVLRFGILAAQIVCVVLALGLLALAAKRFFRRRWADGVAWFIGAFLVAVFGLVGPLVVPWILLMMTNQVG